MVAMVPRGITIDARVDGAIFACKCLSFPIIALGYQELASQYKIEIVENLLGQNKLKRLQMVQFEGPGNKNWPPSMKVKKLEIFCDKMSSKGCKWSSLNGPGH